MRTPLFQRFSLALALALLVGAGDGSFSARVVKVKDGDSFDAIYDKKIKVEVRLFGIDAPERGQPYSDLAREFTSRLIYQRDVTIIPRELDRDGTPVKDKWGRVIAVVILPDGRCLNEELVKAGLAWWYRRYAPDDKKLEALEAEARKAKVGLWALEKPAPVPPWEWRHLDAGGPPADDATGFCASRRSKVYHPCSCEAVSTIDPKNLVRYRTEEEAQRDGKNHCRCKK